MDGLVLEIPLKSETRRVKIEVLTVVVIDPDGTREAVDEVERCEAFLRDLGVGWLDLELYNCGQDESHSGEESSGAHLPQRSQLLAEKWIDDKVQSRRHDEDDQRTEDEHLVRLDRDGSQDAVHPGSLKDPPGSLRDGYQTRN